MAEYKIQTDLACESDAPHDAGKGGTSYFEREENGFKIAVLKVLNEHGERESGKKRGSYITLFCDMICDIEGADFDAFTELVAKELSRLATDVLKREPKCVLVAGLGNREITADNIGPKTVDKLTVTRHLKEHNATLFNSFFKVPLCAVAPGVLGQTGIETAEMIGGVCDRSKPDLVIAVDALAARSTSRLGTTVQISDSGIFPGSGIGNKRNEISRDTLGIPVIAIGVPTVVNSSTLVYDALMRAGQELDDALIQVLREGESFFVSPRQSDMISERVSELLANALNRLFSY
ncbi:MAG: GPR endopeptidase [Clostridia bacterium]|nr:GPR endopeptidase [Clostridia bacterium]